MNAEQRAKYLTVNKYPTEYERAVIAITRLDAVVDEVVAELKSKGYRRVAARIQREFY